MASVRKYVRKDWIDCSNCTSWFCHTASSAKAVIIFSHLLCYLSLAQLHIKNPRSLHFPSISVATPGKLSWSIAVTSLWDYKVVRFIDGCLYNPQCRSSLDPVWWLSVLKALKTKRSAGVRGDVFLIPQWCYSYKCVVDLIRIVIDVLVQRRDLNAHCSRSGFQQLQISSDSWLG